MLLDVGCGDRPKGNVNVDLHIGHTHHFQKHRFINPKKIPNFIQCDAEFLPFRDDSFTIVHASQVLEHTQRPYNVLREFCRVSKHKVWIEVPALRGITFREQEGHLYTWSYYSLSYLMSLVFPKYQVFEAYQKIRGNILRKLPLGITIIRFLQNFLKTDLIAVGHKHADITSEFLSTHPK